MSNYKSVKILPGNNGWGEYIIVTPSEEKRYIVSMTGGGIDKVALKIAEMTGAEAVDGFNNPVRNENVACAVVNCGGTLRLGVYPKNNIPTVNLNPGGPSGPLAEFCTKELYVSGTTVKNIEFTDEEAKKSYKKEDAKKEDKKAIPDSTIKHDGFLGYVSKIATLVGGFMAKIVNVFYDSARKSINMMLMNMLPFMCFVSIIFAVVMATGVGNWFAGAMSGLLSNVGGLIIFAWILSIPVLSPLLGPGGVMESVLGTLIGTMIAAGTFPVSLVIAAYAAVNVVSGCDFIAVGLSMGEADPDTIRYAVPASLFTRFLTAPIGVLLGWVIGMGIF